MMSLAGKIKSIGILVVGIGLCGVFFNNCAGSFGEIESSSLSSFCSPTCHPETANIEGENIDIRQTTESYMSLLNMSKADFAGTDFTEVMNEQKRRRSLLPQDRNSALVNSVGVLSQSSLAGEICRVFVSKKAATSTLFTGVDLQKTPSETAEAAWLATYDRMAEQIWGRALRPEERAAVSEFIKASITETADSVNLNKTSGTQNLESANLAIMMCTTVLSAPEATFL
ncbi:hypothetical protein [Bdellovibrio sp. HCB337]|uniref:hypothetical protein n=1 Tax=Bdellovibrio sp. HCB337 TaxID=3394358 RepID=UPI0039A50108